MAKESELKKLIMDTINSNPRAKKKMEALKSGKLGNILQCYKESVDEYCPEKTKLDKYTRENFLLKDIVFKPEKTKDTLTSWAKSDIWHSIIEKTGKRPDDYDFEIKFHQVLEEENK